MVRPCVVLRQFKLLWNEKMTIPATTSCAGFYVHSFILYQPKSTLQSVWATRASAVPLPLPLPDMFLQIFLLFHFILMPFEEIFARVLQCNSWGVFGIGLCTSARGRPPALTIYRMKLVDAYIVKCAQCRTGLAATIESNSPSDHAHGENVWKVFVSGADLWKRTSSTIQARWLRQKQKWLADLRIKIGGSKRAQVPVWIRSAAKCLLRSHAWVFKLWLR